MVIGFFLCPIFRNILINENRKFEKSMMSGEGYEILRAANKVLGKPNRREFKPEGTFFKYNLT